MHAAQPLIDEVFSAIRPSNGLLKRVAYSTYLACMPQGFTYLLGKITDKGDQRKAVENGVEALIKEGKAKCLDPLLSALKKGKFMNKDLENIAIRKTFKTASYFEDDGAPSAKRFFDYPVISASDCSNALYASYEMEIRLRNSSTGYWKERITKTWKKSRLTRDFLEMDPIFDKP